MSDRDERLYLEVEEGRSEYEVDPFETPPCLVCGAYGEHDPGCMDARPAWQGSEAQRAPKVCGFCKGGPVGNAARWTTIGASKYAPCPRCGELYKEEEEL